MSGQTVEELQEVIDSLTQELEESEDKALDVEGEARDLRETIKLMKDDVNNALVRLEEVVRWLDGIL